MPQPKEGKYEKVIESGRAFSELIGSCCLLWVCIECIMLENQYFPGL